LPINKKIQKKKKEPVASTSRKEKIIRSLISLAIVLVFLGLPFLIMYFTGTLTMLQDVETLRGFIAGGGVWSYIIFVGIQFLQVTILPLPSVVTTLAGSLVFNNPWIVFLLSFIAVMLGSMFAFWLGRKFGKKLLTWIAGKEDAQKWRRKLGRGRYMFFFMMLFPGFPDDLLCIGAGATSMTWRFFIITNLITRPIMIALTVFLGSGDLIPFSGWGIPVWILLALAMLIIFYCSIKYAKQIEKFMERQAKKLTGSIDKDYVKLYNVQTMEVGKDVLISEDNIEAIINKKTYKK